MAESADGGAVSPEDIIERAPDPEEQILSKERQTQRAPAQCLLVNELAPTEVESLVGISQWEVSSAGGAPTEAMGQGMARQSMVMGTVTERDDTIAWLDDGVAAVQEIIGQRPQDAEELSQECIKVGTRLLLGSDKDAWNLLDSNSSHDGICAVVSCSTSANFPSQAFEDLGIQHLTVDKENEFLFPKAYEEVKAFIEASIEKSKIEGLPAGRVLVHCAKGDNRSCAVCVAWLMSSEGMSLTAAVQLIFRDRPIVLTNDQFVEQLVVYAEEDERLRLE